VDSHLQMTSHVNNVCKSVYLSLRNIGKIRKYIKSYNDCERLVHAFIKGCRCMLSFFFTCVTALIS
jgi:hypothetical protein